MDSKPLISIITVVFNGEQYLQQTIDSVRNQTYINLEYIIVDGSSTDGTLSILRNNTDIITTWISEPDKGLYDAMNKGISLSTGVLIGMINSDDWYEDNAVEIMVNAYLNNPEKSIFHADRYDVYDDNRKKTKKFNSSVFKFIYYGMTYNHPSMFITKKEYNSHKYNIELKALSDYQFVLESFLRNNEIFCYVEKTTVNYRLDGLSGQMRFIERLKEGYISRHNAGMNLFQNLFSLLLRASIFIFNMILNYFRRRF